MSTHSNIASLYTLWCDEVIRTTKLDFTVSMLQLLEHQHVGRPMALELLLAGCTVIVTHRFTLI